MRLWRGVAIAIFASAVASRGAAQQGGGTLAGNLTNPQAPKLVPEYGTAGTSSVRLTAFDFSANNGGGYGGSFSGIGRYPTNDIVLMASVHVPGGTKITRVELDYCDTSAVSPLQMDFLKCDNQGQNCGSVMDTITAPSTGCGFAAQDGLAVHVDNYHNMYALEARFTLNDGSQMLTGAIVSYQLEVSQAPGSPTFPDVPASDPAFQYIEALYASGITAGCGGGNYCPDATLTRRQMAVFLAKALGLYWNFQ